MPLSAIQVPIHRAAGPALTWLDGARSGRGISLHAADRTSTGYPPGESGGGDWESVFSVTRMVVPVPWPSLSG